MKHIGTVFGWLVDRFDLLHYTRMADEVSRVNPLIGLPATLGGLMLDGLIIGAYVGAFVVLSVYTAAVAGVVVAGVLAGILAKSFVGGITVAVLTASTAGGLLGLIRIVDFAVVRLRRHIV